MATITRNELFDAAEEVEQEENTAIKKAGGRIVNGITVLAKDTSVPDDKKIKFLNAIADLFNRGVLATVATLTGQPDARLALEGGTITPDPVTDPTPASGTSTDTEKAALKAQDTAIRQWISANGVPIATGEDLTDVLTRLLTTKVDAAKAAPADMVKISDIKPLVIRVGKIVGNMRDSHVPRSSDKVISGENFTELTRQVVAPLALKLGITADELD